MDSLNLHLELLTATPRTVKLEPFCHIGFIGRSNVGKSSLINLLTKKQQVAHTSSNPGKTRTLNFYKTQYPLYLVDMPGYGYAKVPKTEREKWVRMFDEYFSLYQDRLLLFILLDSRHPLQPADKEFLLYIRSFSMPKVICFTKIDQSGQKDLAASRKSLAQFYTTTGSEYQVIESSSKTSKGKKELLSIISDFQTNYKG